MDNLSLILQAVLSRKCYGKRIQSRARLLLVFGKLFHLYLDGVPALRAYN